MWTPAARWVHRVQGSGQNSLSVERVLRSSLLRSAPLHPLWWRYARHFRRARTSLPHVVRGHRGIVIGGYFTSPPSPTVSGRRALALQLGAFGFLPCSAPLSADALEELAGGFDVGVFGAPVVGEVAAEFSV